MKSSLEIAQEANIRPITEIAEKYGIKNEELELRGPYIAKVRFTDILKRFPERKGKYILVTGITPTPFGEGKTVHTIGLTQAFGKLGKKAVCCLRQPSMGPVFGIKGGAAGGGYSQVLPMEDINLGFTGDIERVTGAHNLLSAMIDNSLTKGNKLNIDVDNVLFRRVMDMNDRSLRDVVIGLGGKANGPPRQTGFDISAASEVMAILALAKDYKDLRKRLGEIIIGYTETGNAITAEQIKAPGAMTAILKDAIKPNLVQTMDGQACFMHAGPFANIAHGCNSILADEVALRVADYVFTEAGFAADLGAEKFINIKCRQSGMIPDAAVIVSSIRALKMHGDAYKIIPGRPVPREEIEEENVEAAVKGCSNLIRHIENLRKFGLPVIVAINRFATDTDAEIEAVRKEASKAGAEAVVPTSVFLNGAEGGVEIAKEILKALDKHKNFKFLYDENISIKEKIETICKEIYRADGVVYSPVVDSRIKKFEEDGLRKLSICMAKTHLSLSDNPILKGAPDGFTVTIDDIRVSAGAGFIYPIAGKMLTMPGLPPIPSAANIEVDEHGKISGLF